MRRMLTRMRWLLHVCVRVRAGYAAASRNGSRDARARYPASHTASLLGSSRSVDDLTSPGDFPGTEFGFGRSKVEREHKLAFRGY